MHIPELSTAIRLFLVILASYRISWFIAFDYGPFHFMDRFRRLVARKASGPSAWVRTFCDLIHCPLCLGVWFSTVLSVLLTFEGPILSLFLLILGVCGAQHWLTRLVLEER